MSQTVGHSVPLNILSSVYFNRFVLASSICAGSPEHSLVAYAISTKYHVLAHIQMPHCEVYGREANL